jgi:uncharacterized protein
MHDARLFEDVFCLPHGPGFIVYLPLLGIALHANGAFVNLLERALQGEQDARTTLDMGDSFLDLLDQSDQRRASLVAATPPGPFAPTSVSLFLTHDCTLRCLYCYADGGSSKFHMPLDIVTGVLSRVLENVLQQGSHELTVHFHGGGDVSAAWPLLTQTRRYLSDITRPHNISVRTSIGLNGVLNPGQRQWIVDNIDSATVSLDGPPEIQDMHRPTQNGGPSSSLVYETLQAFDKARFTYGIRSTITDLSVSHMEQIVAFVCDHFGALRIKLEPMFSRGRATHARTGPPDAGLFVEGFRRALVKAKSAGRELIYSGVRLDVLTSTFCQASGESCAVTPEGMVTSCYEVLDQGDPLAGTFFYGRYDAGQQAFVVDESRRARLRQLSVLNKPLCKTCFCKWHCAGDCPVKSLHVESTDHREYSDRCRITRELTKDRLVESLQPPG